MDITNAIRVHLDREAQSVLYEPRDWSRCATDCMRHVPTHTIFKVDPDAAAIERNAIGIFDVGAQLVHVCEGHKVPTARQQERLGRAAIAIFLQQIGMWEPEVVDIDVNDRRRKRPHKRLRPAPHRRQP